MRDKYPPEDDPDTARTDELPVLAEDAVVASSAIPELDEELDHGDTGSHETVRVMPREQFSAAARRHKSSSAQMLEEAVRSVLGELAQSRATEARLASAIEQRDAEIADLRAAIARLGKELETLRARASEPAPEPTPDRAYIAGSRDRWEAMEKMLGTHAERIAEMEREREQQVAREQSLEQRVHEAHAQVEDLRGKLAEAQAGKQRADDELQRIGRLLADKERAIGQQTEKVTALQHDLDDRLSGLAKAQVTPAPAAGTEVPPVGGEALRDAAPHPVLICLTSSKPQRHVISAPETLIGRGPDCAIRIVTHFVSREHARLKHENGKVIIQDCGSKNGVFVNSIRVEEHELEHGDSITIGKTRFQFLYEGDRPNGVAH
jgi:chromosome segregation ATPase